MTEALLADKSVHPEGHGARVNDVGDEWGDGAADLFEELRDLSQQWRYSAQVPNPQDVSAAKDWALQLIAMTGQAWPVDGFLAEE